MSNEIRLLWHEAADVDRLVREYFAEHQQSVRCKGNGFVNDAQTLVASVGEIYDRARARVSKGPSCRD